MIAPALCKDSSMSTSRRDWELSPTASDAALIDGKWVYGHLVRNTGGPEPPSQLELLSGTLWGRPDVHGVTAIEAEMITQPTGNDWLFWHSTIAESFGASAPHSTGISGSSGCWSVESRAGA